MIQFARALFTTFQTHKITDTTAILAVVSPFWLPALQQVSSIAALLMPILGAAWLITQISQAWLNRKKKK